MIGDPPRLQIRRRFARVDPALLERFSGRSTSFVVDAMFGAGAIDPAIKPLDPAMRFMGSAITAGAGARDNLAALAALDHVEKGDVLMIAAQAFEGTATLGDNMARIAALKGAAAIVTDGMVRDAHEILAIGLPVFARGVTPNSAFPSGPGTVGLPIDLGGARIEAGDLVLGDADGVVVVPQAIAAEVAARLEEVAAKEATLQSRLDRGNLISLVPPAFREEIVYLD
jgi:4-hydroxy-4-methyl-2-oxoglutarate aldolase